MIKGPAAAAQFPDPESDGRSSTRSGGSGRRADTARTACGGLRSGRRRASSTLRSTIISSRCGRRGFRSTSRSTTVPSGWTGSIHPRSESSRPVRLRRARRRGDPGSGSCTSRPRPRRAPLVARAVHAPAPPPRHRSHRASSRSGGARVGCPCMGSAQALELHRCGDGRRPVRRAAAVASPGCRAGVDLRARSDRASRCSSRGCWRRSQSTAARRCRPPSGMRSPARCALGPESRGAERRGEPRGSSPARRRATRRTCVRSSRARRGIARDAETVDGRVRPPDVSVVVATRNRAALLPDCLASLVEQADEQPVRGRRRRQRVGGRHGGCHSRLGRARPADSRCARACGRPQPGEERGHRGSPRRARALHRRRRDPRLRLDRGLRLVLRATPARATHARRRACAPASP